MFKTARVGWIVVLGVLSSGCPGASSRPYEPASEVEASLVETASREFRVRDVGPVPAELVVWAGIVRALDARDTDSGRPVIELDVEQRHFDWVEDSGLQPERFFLSPLGDGTFHSRWQLPRVVSAKDVRENMLPRDMVVVYGKPRLSDDGAVEMATTEYIRLIPAAQWRDDVLSYGPGVEPKSRGTPGLAAQPLEDK